MQRPYLQIHRGGDSSVILTPTEDRLITLARVCGWRAGLAIRHVKGFQIRLWRGEVGSIVEVNVPRKGLKRFVAREVRKFLRSLS